MEFDYNHRKSLQPSLTDDLRIPEEDLSAFLELATRSGDRVFNHYGEEIAEFHPDGGVRTFPVSEAASHHLKLLKLEPGQSTTLPPVPLDPSLSAGE